MALVEQIAQAAAARQGRTGGTTGIARQDRPAAKTWLNVGYQVEDKFVNLPLGLAIDTMEPAQVRGQNEEWVMLQNARNELLKELQALGDSLQPGEEQEINLIVKIRHVNDAVSVDPETNPLSLKAAGFSLVK